MSSLQGLPQKWNHRKADEPGCLDPGRGACGQQHSARTCRALDERLDSGNRNIVVDLNQVDYMSSAGLRELVAALKRAKTSGGDVRSERALERVAEC